MEILNQNPATYVEGNAINQPATFTDAAIHHPQASASVNIAQEVLAKAENPPEQIVLPDKIKQTLNFMLPQYINLLPMDEIKSSLIQLGAIKCKKII